MCDSWNKSSQILVLVASLIFNGYIWDATYYDFSLRHEKWKKNDQYYSNLSFSRRSLIIDWLNYA